MPSPSGAPTTWRPCRDVMTQVGRLAVNHSQPLDI
jgi:hypothetical protein